MHGIKLNSAVMNYSSMAWSEVHGAQIAHANLAKADLSGAKFQNSNFFRSNLYGSSLQNADFSDSDLAKVILSRANLKYTNFSGASLVRAQLLNITSIGSAVFEGADISGAIFHNVDLSETQIKFEQLNQAFGDASVILPRKMKRPRHWLRFKAVDQELPHASGKLFEEWRRWLEDPEEYSPASHPHF